MCWITPKNEENTHFQNNHITQNIKAHKSKKFEKDPNEVMQQSKDIDK